MFTPRQVIMLAASLLSLAGPANGQQASSSVAAPTSIAQDLRHSLMMSKSREAFVQDTVQGVRAFARDGVVITQRDIEEVAVVGRAAFRAHRLSRILSNDLDGDGKVTRPEVETYIGRMLRNQPEGTRAAMIQQVLALDTNHDGVVDIEEMRREELPDAGDFMAERLRALLALDPNKDGRLTTAEAEELAIAAWQAADIDGNGVLSPEERGRLSDRIVEDRQRDAAPKFVAQASCRLPRPAADEKVIVFASYEGYATPTVTLVGPDIESFVARVVVASGSEPLYVVLVSSYPVIWRFEGAVNRLSRVVLMTRQRNAAGQSGAGLTGIPRDKVVFGGALCVQNLHSSDAIDSAAARGTIASDLGRAPDIFFTSYKAAIVRLLEAKVDPAPPARHEAPLPVGYDRPTWQRHMASTGAIIDLDPARVVAEGSAERYDVAPQVAGLSQLVGSGALIYVPETNTYKIVQQIARFPAGLAGAHSVRFLLARGVPLPAGSPGHSCVISEETGRPLGEPLLCR